MLEHRLARGICLAIACGVTGVAQTTWAQSPLVNTGNVPVNVGYPHLHLGYPTQTVIDPEVGRVVRLARGFGATPNFTYSFTHPLAPYQHPLMSQGPFGTYNSPVRPNQDHSIDLKITPRSDVPSLADAGPRQNALPPFQFLPSPWHVAATKAKYVPSIGAYLHPSADGPMKGAFVTGIKVGGIGHQAGLLPGDVITAIDGQTLSSTEAYSDATKNLEPPWSFDVWNAHTNRHNTLEWSGTSG